MKAATELITLFATLMALSSAAPCRNRQWRHVDVSMIQRTVEKGVTVHYYHIQGQLVIKGKVTHFGCGRLGSGAITYIRGDWTRIMYTQEFRGSASCWKIFGGTSYPKYRSTFGFGHGIWRNNLKDFSKANGDAIFSENKMNSASSDTFDGKTYRCDSEKQNFWHHSNGKGLRSATVMLRRKGTGHAGISTETSCGTPSYTIKDIYIYI